MNSKNTNKLIFGYLGKVISAFLLVFSVVAIISSVSFEMFNGFNYFTNQSNFLIIIVLTMYLFNKTNTKVFKYLSFITLVSISITALIYHVLLAGDVILDQTLPYLFKTGIQSMFTHTINPIMYVLFYFFVNKTTVKYKDIYVGLIHPLVYLLFFIITGSITKFYPYDFIDISKNGFLSVFLTVIAIAPLVLLLTFIFIYLKQKLIKKEIV